MEKHNSLAEINNNTGRAELQAPRREVKGMGHMAEVPTEAQLRLPGAQGQLIWAAVQGRGLL